MKRSFEDTQTQSIMQKLRHATDIDTVDRLIDTYKPLDFINYLERIILLKKLKSSHVFKASQISRVYGYQILKGLRIPSRDKVIQISFGLSLQLDETQELLKIAGYKELYPKLKRDCYLIHAIEQRQDLIQVNQLLYEKNLPLFE